MTQLQLADVAVDARLESTSLTFNAGTLTALVGENGAGKSTLLDIAAGLLAPTRGAVFTHGTRVDAMSAAERARAIASLGQREPDVDDLIVVERIALGLSARRGAFASITPEVRARIEAIASELGVRELLERRTGTLSAGERRRVAVARSLVDTEAQVVLIDEPHAAVDIARASLVTAALRSRAQTSAVVFSVHDVGVALTADRVVGLREGHVVFDGAPTELRGDALARVFGVSNIEIVRLG